MRSAPNVYMFVYILIGTHMVPLNYIIIMLQQYVQSSQGRIL